jgi:hypothetical protein
VEVIGTRAGTTPSNGKNTETGIAAEGTRVGKAGTFKRTGRTTVRSRRTSVGTVWTSVKIAATAVGMAAILERAEPPERGRGRGEPLRSSAGTIVL